MEIETVHSSEAGKGCRCNLKKYFFPLFFSLLLIYVLAYSVLVDNVVLFPSFDGSGHSYSIIDGHIEFRNAKKYAIYSVRGFIFIPIIQFQRVLYELRLPKDTFLPRINFSVPRCGPGVLVIRKNQSAIKGKPAAPNHNEEIPPVAAQDIDHDFDENLDVYYQDAEVQEARRVENPTPPSSQPKPNNTNTDN